MARRVKKRIKKRIRIRKEPSLLSPQPVVSPSPQAVVSPSPQAVVSPSPQPVVIHSDVSSPSPPPSAQPHPTQVDDPMDLNESGKRWKVDEINMMLQHVQAGMLSPFSVMTLMAREGPCGSVNPLSREEVKAWYGCMAGCLDVVDGLIGKWDAYKDQERKERASRKHLPGVMRARKPAELGCFFWDLFIVVLCGFPEEISRRTLRLLKEGAIACDDRYCAALFAALEGDSRTVKGSHADMDKVRSASSRLVKAAAMGGDVETFTFLTQESMRSYNACGVRSDGDTMQAPIECAIEANQMGLVQYLLSESGYSYSELVRGGSGLVVACRSGYLEMIELFLTLEDPAEARALEEAAEGGHVEAVQFLLEGEHSDIREEGGDALAAAIRGGEDAVRDPNTHAEVIAVLAGMEGIRPNSKALLSKAASNGNEQVVQALVDARDALGLDLNGGRGLKPPLLAAVEKNHVAVVEVLMNTPGLVTTKSSTKQDMKGWTALHIAAHGGFTEICALLLRGSDVNPGLNPNVTDRKGMTPLHLAAERLHLETVKVLAGTEGIDINLTVHIPKKPRVHSSIKDFTPLQLALSRGKMAAPVATFLRSVGGRAISPPTPISRRSTRTPRRPPRYVKD